jgi:FG-GAP-like repeat
MTAATRSRSAVHVAAAFLLAAFVTAAAGADRADPSFVPSGLIEAGGIPCSFTVARLDGDANPDLAAANCSADRLTVLLGDGAGHFRGAPGSPTRVGKAPTFVESADLNGDGKADLALSNYGSKDITVLLGDGSGRFSAAPGSPVATGGDPRAFAIADLNGDGRLDLAVPIPNRVAILLGDGTGRFGSAPGSPLVVPQRSGPGRVTVAEFNGDGKPDLAVSTTDPMRIEILAGDGVGGFRSVAMLNAGLKAVADFNGDAEPDLAVASRASSRAPYKATVLLGTGAGRFSAAPGLVMKGDFWSTEAVAADLNADQKLDLAYRDAIGTVALLFGDGQGRLRPAVDSSLPLPAFSEGGFDLTAGDMNGDGQIDLVVPAHQVVERGGKYGIAILWRAPSAPAIGPGGSFPSRRDPIFSTRAPIWALAGDGRRAAVVTARNRPCGPVRIVVWTAPGRASRSFAHRCFGDAVTQVALGGGQVGWLQKGGGNDLELIVTAAQLSGGKSRQIEFTTNGNRAGGDPRGGWLGELLGGGPLLAYDSWTITCDVPDGEGCDNSLLIVSQQRLVRIVARRRKVVKRGSAAYALVAVGGGRMALESNGAITVMTPKGSRVSAVAPAVDNPPRGVALSRTRLAVLRTFTLDIYAPATGRQTKSIPLGSAATLELAGVNSGLALLRSARRLVLVRLRDGKLISLALRFKTNVDARLTSAGLVSAYNVRRGRARGQIVFEPTARLLARF